MLWHPLIAQAKLEADHEGAVRIWQTIGVYMGYAVAHYADFYDLAYEDLFDGADESQKLNQLYRIVRFLRVPTRRMAGQLPAIRAELDPRRRRVGTRERYRQIPNLAEVMREFGVDEQLCPVS